MGTNQSWKKKLQTDTSYESLLDLKEENFIWNTPYAAEFLPPEKLAELNYQMNLIKFSVKRELDYKYLQFNLLIDCLDEMIAEAKSKPI